MISQVRITVLAGIRALIWKANKKTSLLLRLCSSNVGVFIGDNSVTNPNGLQLINNTYVPVILDNGDSLYAISDAPAVIEGLIQA